MNNRDVLRLLPSVDQVLRKPEVAGLIESYARPVVTEALREVLQEARSRVLDGGFDQKRCRFPSRKENT